MKRLGYFTFLILFLLQVNSIDDVLVYYGKNMGFSTKKLSS